MEAAANKTPKSLLARSRKAGLGSPFLREAILPEWWDASCEADPALLPELEIRLARFLGVSLDLVRNPALPLEAPWCPGARLRRPTRPDSSPPTAAVHAALAIARATLRSLRAPLPAVELPPVDPVEWHRQLCGQGTELLRSAVADLWRRGIPVIHVEVLPSPRMHGLAAIVSGRPVIVLGHDIDVPARLFSHVAHEVGHLVAGDCAEDAPVVDESDEDPSLNRSERQADAYALAAALGAAPPRAPANLAGDFRVLARAGLETARRLELDAGSLLWFWTTQRRDFPAGVQALQAIYRHKGGAAAVRAAFDAHVDLAAASETDRALLRCVKGEPERDAAAR